MEECFLYVALQFGALDGFWWNSWCLLPTTISLFEEKKSFWRKNVVVKKALKCPSKSFKQAQLNAVLTSQQLQRLHGGDDKFCDLYKACGFGGGWRAIKCRFLCQQSFKMT